MSNSFGEWYEIGMMIAVCDDNPAQLAQIEHQLLGGNDTVFTFQSSVAFLDYIEKKPYPFDLLILDIDMPEIDGLRVGVELRKTQPNAVIVLATQYKEFALRAYQIRPLDYLVKPVHEAQLHRIVEEVRSHLQHMELLTVKNGTDVVRLPIHEVRYLESFDWRLVIHAGIQTYSTAQRMKDMENSLHPKGFLRVHRSFLVNKAHIQTISRKQRMLRLYTGEMIPISRNMVNPLIDSLAKERSHIFRLFPRVCPRNSLWHSETLSKLQTV